MAHNWRVTLTALVVAPILALTGCSSDSEKEPDWTGASEGNHNDQGAPPVNTSPGRGHGSDELCNDPELAGKKTDAFCNNATPAPANSHIKKVNEHSKGHKAPVSNDYGGRVNVQGYLLSVMKAQRHDWRRYFEGSSFSVPAFAADIVSGTEKYNSRCPKSQIVDSTIMTITATSPHGLFCRIDEQDAGSIALPADTIAKLWKNHDRKTADMAAAIVASRAGGYKLNWELSRQNAGGSINQLAGSCLAGVWARGAYSRDEMDDLDRALVYAKAIPIKLAGNDEPNAEDSDTAWQIGYANGSVSACSDPTAWLLEGLN